MTSSSQASPAAPAEKTTAKPKPRLLRILAGLLIILFAICFTARYFLDSALENKDLRKLLGHKTARFFDANAGFLPLRSNGLSLSSRGALVQAAPPRGLTELRAAGLSARCNLAEIWHGKWRIDNLLISHLQGASGADAAQHLDRTEFATPEMLPPSRVESPIDLDFQQIVVAQTDLYWGTTAEAGGEFRDVVTNFYPRDKKLTIHGRGGTCRLAKWPVARVEQFKLFYANLDLRVDEALFTLGGSSLISVLGNFCFDEQQSLDLQLTLTRCPVGPFLSGEQRMTMEGDFDASCHLQKDATQTESARAAGSIALAQAILKNVPALQRAAEFTGRQELAHLPLNKVSADYDWNWPVLSVKNLVIESNGLVVVKGEFSIKDQKIDGEFQIGVAPNLAEKFPGAREEIFTRAEGDYVWTKLTVSGKTDNLRDDLRPRLVRAAQTHFSKEAVVPIFKPGKTVIEAIEEL